MTSLADLLNSPTEFIHGDKTYTIRAPVLDECGMYQRWLESEARASAAAATELPEEDRRNLLRDTNRDIASKLYAWNGALCVQSLTTPDGIAKLMSIVCRAQGLTFRVAMEIVEASLLEIATALDLAREAAEHDPEKKADLVAFLKTRRRPGDFLSISLSGSPTTPAAPPNSAPSPTCPSDS